MRILRIGVPAAFDGFLLWAGHFVFLRVIAGLGAGAEGQAIFAAHVVGVQVEAINYLPASAWGTAAATVIGQCLGARYPDRARHVGHEAVLQACLMAAGVSLLFYFGAHFIYATMHEDPNVARIGVPSIRLLALFEIPLSVVIVYCVAIRGAGETFRPMLINTIGIFLIRLPVAWWLGVELQLGLPGAWGGMGVDLFLRATAFLLYFRYGNWDRTDV